MFAKKIAKMNQNVDKTRKKLSKCENESVVPDEKSVKRKSKTSIPKRETFAEKETVDKKIIAKEVVIQDVEDSIEEQRWEPKLSKQAQAFVDKYNEFVAIQKEEEKEWESYSTKELEVLLDVTEEEASVLVRSGLFTVYRVGTEYRSKKKDVKTFERTIHTVVNYKKNNTMSVIEMGRVLGLRKTNSYGVVAKNFFKTTVIFGKLRVDIASFEDWYSKQYHYKKVDGEEPGSFYEPTVNTRDIAMDLGVSKTTVFEIISKNNLPYFMVDGERRIYKKGYDSWYASQERYCRVKKKKED